MAEATKASELLAKMRASAGLQEPEIKPLAKALAKKDEPEEKEVEYVWGYIKQMSTGHYLGGLNTEGDPYFAPDYREADYIKREKKDEIDIQLPEWMIEHYADPELGIDDFMFIEAVITLKG